MKLYVFGEDGTFEKVENGGKPAGILLTIPEKFFDEIVDAMAYINRAMEADVPDGTVKWYNTISGIPKLPVDFCYLVFKGKVQYRLTIVDIQHHDIMTFQDEGGVRTFLNKKWIRLTGPAEKAPRDLWMRGFQGFRYADFIF